jgi:hypothetical protein
MNWRGVLNTALAVSLLLAMANLLILHTSIMAYYDKRLAVPLQVCSIAFYAVTAVLLFVYVYRNSRDRTIVKAIATVLIAVLFGWVFAFTTVFLVLIASSIG